MKIDQSTLIQKEQLVTSRGFSLVEVLLAVSIFTLIVTGFAGAFLYGQESTVLAGNHVRATFIAEEGLEIIRNIRDASFTNLVDGTHGLAVSGNQWVLSGSSDITDIFTRQITISTIDADTKQIVSFELMWIDLFSLLMDVKVVVPILCASPVNFSNTISCKPETETEVSISKTSSNPISLPEKLSPLNKVILLVAIFTPQDISPSTACERS